jgi:serine/threonine protein kinase/Tfp pilus assembly protein PilF
MGCHSVGGWNAIPSNKIAGGLRGIDGFARLSGTVRTSDIRACPVCGTLLPDGNESCPVCALRGALESESMPFAAGKASSDSEFRFEHYQVLKNEDGTPVELGHGAMGVTYKAVDVRLQCPVALKIINARLIGDASARHRFVREARAAASVRHPNVASVFHLGERGGNYFYAMEFVDGETLEKVIRRSGRLQTDVALEVVAQIAAGLTAIQKQHLVHRDIKPSNIMISFEEDRIETVKIIDLGLAKGIAEETISTVGSFTGTPEYASPEQFAGVPTDIRSDLYSLGITLWEMLSGKLPFQGSPVDLMYQHQHAALPEQKLENAPAPVIALLQILLAKEPGERFQDPARLQKALTKVKEAIASASKLTAKDLRAAADQVAQQSPKEILRKHTFRWLLSAAFGLVALMLGLLFFAHYQRHFLNQQSTLPGLIEKSIAVLPFESLSESKSDSYFADGVQDEILSNLSKVSQLRVISRTSVMTYRSAANRDLPSIAAALGVAKVVEGTVRRDRNRVRVTTELIDARTDETLWSDSYDRELTDVFAIQSDIAQKVAAKLSAHLSPEERKSIEQQPTNNLEAYDLYLQAKELVTNSIVGNTGDSRASLLDAIRLLEEATQRDASFALAFCLIAKADDWLYLRKFDEAGRRVHGDGAVNQALHLRPDLPEVYLAAAFHRYICYRDYERARVQIAIARRALPNSADALALAAYLDRRQGRWSESTEALEEASKLDPRNPEILEQLKNSYASLRRYGDCAEIFDRMIALMPEDSTLKVQKVGALFEGNADLVSYRAALETLPAPIKDDKDFISERIIMAVFARDWTAAKEILNSSPNKEFYFYNTWWEVPRECLQIWLAHTQGDGSALTVGDRAAREQLKQKVTTHPEEPALLSTLGMIDAFLGRKEEAIQEARRAVEMLPISRDALDGPPLVEDLAVVYASTNEVGLALQALATLVKIPNGISYGDLKLNPNWDPLRKDPRFDRLMATLSTSH